MIFIKILLQYFMKIQSSFIILRKISENSVHFSQFLDTFTLKHDKYREILRYLCSIQIL